MSAYIVDRGHVAYLVEAGAARGLAGAREREPLSWYWRGKRREHDPERVGAMLWSTNAASVAHRYPDSPADEMPGPCGGPFEYGEHNPPASGMLAIMPGMPAVPLQTEPVQLFKSLACYEYQSCEHPGWEASEARAYCEALRDRAISALPGWDAAEWGAPDAWIGEGAGR